MTTAAPESPPASPASDKLCGQLDDFRAARALLETVMTRIEAAEARTLARLERIAPDHPRLKAKNT